MIVGYMGRPIDSPLIRHELYRKRRLQHSSVFACIPCRGNVSTDPLTNDYRGIDIQTHRLTGVIYEIRR